MQTVVVAIHIEFKLKWYAIYAKGKTSEQKWVELVKITLSTCLAICTCK